MNKSQPKSFRVNEDELPVGFPVHLHSSEFWSSLGKAVATFGFLEQVLLKAIFALTGTRSYSEELLVAEYSKWQKKLEKALSDQLGGLIKTFEQAVREHPDCIVDGFDCLVDDLQKASRIRNVICHGSWDAPDESGASLPFFVNRQMDKFETRIDCSFLDKVQLSTKGLICKVINSVTTMGFQFPGSNSPGGPVWVGRA